MDLDNELVEIIKIYETLLENSYGYDIIRNTSNVMLKAMAIEQQGIKSTEPAIIDSVTSLLSTIRKRIDSTTEKIKTEKNESFQRLVKYHNELTDRIEGKNGIFSKIEKKETIREEIRNLRSCVYSIKKTLSILVSDEILIIEKLTDITLKLRELEIVQSAELLESLTLEKMDNITKVTKVRSAFEQTLIAILESHAIKTTKSFFHNLNALTQNSLIEKALQKSFSKHYSFVSKIIHAEIEASNENVMYGLNIILQIIWKILPIFKQKE